MIFPDWGSAPTKTGGAETLPLYTEWAVDWDKGCFALRNGHPYTVSGTEALQIWVRCALLPENARFCCSAHSPEYGNQLAAYLDGRTDQGILENLLRREIRETLLVSPYIQAVDGFSFTRSGSRLTTAFTVHTVYDDLLTQTEVDIS